jgi:hypothetical protein
MECVKLLQRYRCNKKIRDNSKNTVYEYYIERGVVKVAKLIND